MAEAKKRSTAAFYRKNRESYEKKKAYDKKFQKGAEYKKKAAERKRFKRKIGKLGKMGNMDASHTKSGRIVLEHRSKNRARQGAGGKPKKK